MIPIKEIRESMEKDAGIGSAIGGAIAYAVKHPWQIILPVAAISAGSSLVSHFLDSAERVHPAHQMYMEGKKRVTMIDQSDTLKEILGEIKKTNTVTRPPSGPKLIQPPLG